MASTQGPSKRQRTNEEEEETLGSLVDKRNASKDLSKKGTVEEKIPEALRFLKASDRDKFVSETFTLDSDYVKGNVHLKAGEHQAVRWIQLPENQGGGQYDLATLRLADFWPICDLIGLKGFTKHSKNPIRILLHRTMQQARTVGSSGGAAIGLLPSDKKRLRLNTIIRICNHLFSPELKEHFLNFNDSRGRAEIERGAGAKWERFYSALMERCFPHERSGDAGSGAISGLVGADSLTPSLDSEEEEDSATVLIRETELQLAEARALINGGSGNSQGSEPTQGPSQYPSLCQPYEDSSDDDSLSGGTGSNDYTSSDNGTGSDEEVGEVAGNAPYDPDVLDDFKHLHENPAFDQDHYEDFMGRYHPINPKDYLNWPLATVKETIASLVKSRAIMFTNMHDSGTHTSQPYDFCGPALKRTSCVTTIGECALAYFYWKSKSCADYDTKFSPFLKDILKGGSTDVEQMLADDDSPSKYRKADDVAIEKLSLSLVQWSDLSKVLHANQNELIQVNLQHKKHMLRNEQFATLNNLYQLKKNEEANDATTEQISLLDKEIQELRNRLYPRRSLNGRTTVLVTEC